MPPSTKVAFRLTPQQRQALHFLAGLSPDARATVPDLERFGGVRWIFNELVVPDLADVWHEGDQYRFSISDVGRASLRASISDTQARALLVVRAHGNASRGAGVHTATVRSLLKRGLIERDGSGYRLTGIGDAIAACCEAGLR